MRASKPFHHIGEVFPTLGGSITCVSFGYLGFAPFLGVMETQLVWPESESEPEEKQHLACRASA